MKRLGEKGKAKTTSEDTKEAGEPSPPIATFSLSQGEGRQDEAEGEDRRKTRSRQGSSDANSPRGTRESKPEERDQQREGEEENRGSRSPSPSDQTMKNAPNGDAESRPQAIGPDETACLSATELERKKQAEEMEALRVLGGGAGAMMTMSLEPLKRYQPFFLFCVELYKQRVSEDMTALTDEIDRFAVSTLLPHAENHVREVRMNSPRLFLLSAFRTFLFSSAILFSLLFSLPLLLLFTSAAPPQQCVMKTTDLPRYHAHSTSPLLRCMYVCMRECMCINRRTETLMYVYAHTCDEPACRRGL